MPHASRFCPGAAVSFARNETGCSILVAGFRRQGGALPEPDPCALALADITFARAALLQGLGLARGIGGSGKGINKIVNPLSRTKPGAPCLPGFGRCGTPPFSAFRGIRMPMQADFAWVGFCFGPKGSASVNPSRLIENNRLR